MTGRAGELKTKGNNCFKEGQYERAKKYYSEGKLAWLNKKDTDLLTVIQLSHIFCWVLPTKGIVHDSVTLHDVP